MGNKIAKSIAAVVGIVAVCLTAMWFHEPQVLWALIFVSWIVDQI
jgi:hypothetical protein